MFKKIFIIGFLIWGIDTSLSMNEQHPHDQHKSPFTVLAVNGHKIYTAKIQLKTGEIAYFGFEPIYDNTRSNKWQTFHDLTMYLTSENRGPLGMLFMPHLYEKALTKIFPKTKKHEAEIIRLIREVPSEKKKSMERSLFGISGGVSGFSYSVGSYVAYISREPIIGFFPLPEVEPDAYDFDAYIDSYDDLIMVVSSFDSSQKNRDKFTERGIFRIPMSVLRKDYTGIGIFIHALSAWAQSEKDPNKIFMEVNPDINTHMLDLLDKTFTKDDMTVEGSHYTIKIDALKKKLLEANILR